jgi:hypothetical protein
MPARSHPPPPPPTPRRTVRDAALDCLQEIYRVMRADLVENIVRQDIRPASLKCVGERGGEGGVLFWCGKAAVGMEEQNGSAAGGWKGWAGGSQWQLACGLALAELIAHGWACLSRVCGRREVVARLNEIEPTGINLAAAAAAAPEQATVAAGGTARRASVSPDAPGAKAGPGARPAPTSARPGGGVAGAPATGDVGDAPPVAVGSERELAQEVEGLVGLLSTLLVRLAGPLGWPCGQEGGGRVGGRRASGPG